MPAILILVCVGAMVGTWMASGTIPMMIYYGVQIVNPKFMLVTAFLIEAVVSVVTGTSWGSVATMGVALMGIGKRPWRIPSGYCRRLHRRFLLW